MIIFIIITYSSYREKLRKNSLPQILAYHLDCKSGKIDESILNLHSDTSLVGAYVNFSQSPDDKESKEALDRLDVYLDEGSQLFEISPKIYARIPTENLCDLVRLEIVSYVSLPKDNNTQKYEAK